MANTNRRNPNTAVEPTHQSRRAADKRPTADSPALRFRQYDRGGPKDPQESLTDTLTRTKATRKSPPELTGTCPVIQETNVNPPAVLPATLDSEEVAALLPPTVPTDGQEATTKPPANHKEATAQLPHIVPKPPQIG